MSKRTLPIKADNLLTHAHRERSKQKKQEQRAKQNEVRNLQYLRRKAELRVVHATCSQPDHGVSCACKSNYCK